MEQSRVLYEDNHLLIINKNPGEIVQGDKTGDVPLVDMVKQYIKDKYNKPGDVFLGLVHRVDRPVSGAVIFAKTSKALTRLTVAIKERDFSKTYLAITETRPDFEETILADYLKKNEASNKSHVVTAKTPGAKLAQLSCKHVASGKTLHLLEVDLHTGRHHQIRVQLAHAGLVIRGDVKYGAKRPNKDGSISLHAWKVSFKHPVADKIVKVTAPLPNSPEWNAFNDAN
ncbi:MAG TPA: RNA pseudouridine synthase [Lentimicrobium sp.]|nr:RNA pseudouridine synthase [Lentimicrobium sp.]